MIVMTRCLPFVVAFALVSSVGGRASAQTGPLPLRSPVDVNVVGGTVGLTGPVEVTGSVGVSGTVAATQAGEWTVRSAAQIQTETVRPTCAFVNQCTVSFAAVPAGKILRVTNLHGFLRMGGPTTSGIVSLHFDSASASTALFVLPATPFGAAYYGQVLSLNEKVDIVFTTGQVPVLEVGTTGSFVNASTDRLGITATLLPAPPTP